MRTIKGLGPNGPVELRAGWIGDRLAVTKILSYGDKAPWNITHLKTGLQFGFWPKFRDAVACAALLQEMFPFHADKECVRSLGIGFVIRDIIEGYGGWA